MDSIFFQFQKNVMNIFVEFEFTIILSTRVIKLAGTHFHS